MLAFSDTPTAVRRAWTGLVLTLGLLWLLSVLPPWIADAPRQVVYQIFAPVCHQIPARSFQMGGIPVALCHRCFGVFSGLVLTAAAFWVFTPFDAVLMRRSRLLILTALAIVGIDWTLDVLGLWTNTPLSRTATGLAFGGVAGYFLARGLVDLARGSGPGAEGDGDSGGALSHIAPPVS